MPDIRSALENIVPISRFNRGEAGKVFEEVKRSGAKVVIKNNLPECVLVSPDEYLRLLDQVNDAALLSVASARMDHADRSAFLEEHEVNAALGIAPSDLEGFDEVEIE